MAFNLFPQLRVVLNTTCGKHCRYCRPSGEAACSVAKENSLTMEEMYTCIEYLVRRGIEEVRLTGGDPAFYPHGQLVELVRRLSRLNLHGLSLITRSSRIREVLPQLKAAGLPQLTFSLDSMDAHRWADICGIGLERRHEHQELLDTIEEALKVGFKVNLNCVLIDESAAVELPSLVDFVRRLQIGLKVEEVIRDIGDEGERLHANLNPLKQAVRQQAVRCERHLVHGGLGHPMETIYLQDGGSVTWKMFDEGACYGPGCRSCQHFPCDDALMALRLLPDGRLQTCLKRMDNLVDLVSAIQNQSADLLLQNVLKEYSEAKRLTADEIEQIRRLEHAA